MLTSLLVTILVAIVLVSLCQIRDAIYQMVNKRFNKEYKPLI